MAAWEYDNFDLLIETEDDGQYRARVIEAPTGESPTGTFRIPFEPTQLENLMLKLDPGRSGTRRIAADPQSQAAQELGSGLFDAVFSSDIRLTWARSHRHGSRRPAGPAAAAPADRVAVDRGAALGAALRPPPEQLHRPVRADPRRPLSRGAADATRASTSTGRCASSSSSRRRPTSPSSTSRPSGVASRAPWPGGRPRARCTSTGSNSRRSRPSRRGCARHDVHVLHFIGHGEYDARSEDGVLYFTDRYGRRAPVSSSMLGPYLRDHDPLRLVFLNACQSARVNSSDPFSDMAQGLVQQDCVAVVAMQFPISDGAAADFTGEFYGSVADGLPVDQSVGSGRKALLAAYASEWATPVLFLRDPDGKVFDNIVPQVASADVVETDVADAGRRRGGSGPVRRRRRCGRGGCQRHRRRSRSARGCGVDPRVTIGHRTCHRDRQPSSRHGADREPGGRLGGGARSDAGANARHPHNGRRGGRRDPAAAEPITETPPSMTPTAEPAVTTASGVAATAAAGAATARAAPASAPPDTVRIPTPPGPPPNRFVGRIVAVVLVLGLLGYLGWWFTQNRADDTGTATPPTTTSETTGAETSTSEAPPVVSKQVTVPGNTSWTDAGVSCQPGRTIELNATGTAFHNPATGVGPDGTPTRSYDSSTCPDCPTRTTAPSSPASTPRPPFTVVGASATYQCQGTGELFLGPNDAGVDNNSGQWTVTVTPSG